MIIIIIIIVIIMLIIIICLEIKTFSLLLQNIFFAFVCLFNYTFLFALLLVYIWFLFSFFVFPHHFLFSVDFNSFFCFIFYFFVVSHYLKMMTLQPWAQSSVVILRAGLHIALRQYVCVWVVVCVCARLPVCLPLLLLLLHLTQFRLICILNDFCCTRCIFWGGGWPARGVGHGRRGWLFGYVVILLAVVVVVQLLPLPLLLVIKWKLIFLFKVFGLLALRSISPYTNIYRMCVRACVCV